MNDRKKEVADWISRIDTAEKERKEWEPVWEKNYKAVYGGDWMKDGRRSDSAISATGIQSQSRYDFDLLLSFLKTEMPALVLSRPEVFLNARQYIDQKDERAQENAKLVEIKINRLLADMDGIETEIRCSLSDGHCAYGIVKVLPKYNIQAHPMANQPVLNEITGEPVEDPSGGKQLLYPDEELVSTPMYEICRVDPFRFIVIGRARNNQFKMSALGERIDKSLEEIKAEGLYDEEIITRLEEKVRERDGKKKDWEVDLTLFEIYDRVNNKVIVICEEWQDDFIRYDDTPPGIEKDPYCVLKFTEIPGQWIPKPEVSSGIVLQDDYRQGREWQREWAKKTKPQLGIKPGVDEKERGKIGDGVSDWVELTGENDVFLLNKDAISANHSLSEHMSLCIKDFDQVMGQSSQDRGLVGEARFATEANIAEVKGNIRGQDKINQVKLFFSFIIEKLLILIQHNPAEDEEFRNMLINTDVDIEIDIESKTAKNKAIERKQLAEVLAIILQNPVFMQSPTLLDQIFRDYDIRERDKIISEIQQASQAQRQAAQPIAEKKGLNLSLSLKHELLPVEAVDKIVDMIMQEDIPVVTQPQQPPVKNKNLQQPDFNESVGAGTEGMSPGSEFGGLS